MCKGLLIQKFVKFENCIALEFCNLQFMVSSFFGYFTKKFVFFDNFICHSWPLKDFCFSFNYLAEIYVWIGVLGKQLLTCLNCD